MTSEHHRRRHLARLRDMARRLDKGAQGNINAPADQRRNKFGYQQEDDAFTIRWALREIDPITEDTRQALAEIASAAE